MIHLTAMISWGRITVVVLILISLTGIFAISADPHAGWHPSARGPDSINGITTGVNEFYTLPDDQIIYIGRANVNTGIVTDKEDTKSPDLTNESTMTSLSVDEKETSVPDVSSAPQSAGILVKYSDDVSALSADSVSINSAIGALSVESYESYGVNGLEKILPPENMTNEAAIDYYESQPGVEYAEPDYIWSAAAVPNDPDLSKQWGLINTGQIYREGYPSGTINADIDADSAWDLKTDSNSVIVAIIDSGVDYNHPDLAANIWNDGSGNHGYNVLTDSYDPMDDNGHGTHCAGIIGAVGNNGIGGSGVSWKATIMPVKVLDSSGNAKVSDIIKAIGWANSHGATIISCSFGSYTYSQATYDAMASSSALFVCAAGNSGTNNDVTPFYPANFALDNIISVAYSDADDNICSKSNYGGSTVDIAAPGYMIYSTYPTSMGNGYAYESGTSMATPFVSGAAAMIKSASPSMTASDIRMKLVSTAENIPSMSGKVIANGRLNLYSALNGGGPVPTPTFIPVPTFTPGPTVTPAPTVIPGDDNIVLEKGWNFIAVTSILSQNCNTASIFASVPSGGHSVFAYDATSGWRTLTAKDKIESLNGYWIYSEKRMSIPVTYTTGQISKQVETGWNTYGVPSKIPVSAKNALSSIDSLWTYYISYNALNQQYDDVIIKGSNDSENMIPGQAGWLYSNGNGIITG